MFGAHGWRVVIYANKVEFYAMWSEGNGLNEVLYT